jgi:beta-lactamase regulating signal transducer with metallopeptidase domain/HEAT repeat protein
MSWYLSAFEFLSHWAVQSTVVLAFAAIAVAFFRQPAKKRLLIQASFVVCLILPGLVLLHVPQNWSWRWPTLGTHWMASRPASGTRQDVDRQPAENNVGSSDAPWRRGRSPSGDRVSRHGVSGLLDNAATEAPPLAARRRAWPDARLACVIGYLAGVALMAAWWLMGWIGLARVLRRSRPADARCLAVLQDIAGPRAACVRLRISSLAGQPFMFGWWRPVIVLPERLASGGPEALRWSLAHEWSHAARGDAWWWSLAGVVRLVLFYQPLAWWLRAQMRLAQDYLADADAAGHAPAPEDYAQFLTAWAGSRGHRPVYGGLGILGRKSELYRRVAMLVQNPSLDRRCSRIWSGAALIALATVAGTVATYSNAADEPESDADRSEKVRIDEIEKQAAAAKPEANPAERARLKALVDGVLKRARAIHSGQFQLFENKGLQFSNTLKQPVIIHLRGDDVSVNRWSQKIHAVRRGDRVMVLDDKGSQPVWEGSQPVQPAELRIYYPTHTIPGETLPRCAGTLPTPAALRFVEKHRDEGRIEGHIPGQDLEDTTSAYLAWSVSEAEAASLFAGASELLARGGTLRISVAEQLGYALPKVEYYDRFGGVQARFEADEFFEAAAGLFFPEEYHVAEREEISYRFERKIGRLNEKLPDEAFLIAIPAGTRVMDIRFPRGAKIDAEGHTFFSSPRPKGFTIGAASFGLSKDLLAEMDRQVLSADEVEQARQAAKRVEPPAAAEAKAAPAAAGEGNAELRYAGRSFDDWRDQLLNDLDEKTCVAAMGPIVSFGKKGYTKEAIAALAQTLHDDRHHVVNNATNALGQIGAAAIPALMDGLADPRPHVRRSSAIALGTVGREAKAATPSLLKLIDDQDAAARSAAIAALISVAGDEAGLQPTFERIADSDASSDRHALFLGLAARRPRGGGLLRLLLRLTDDEDVSLRAPAAQLLADCGPPTDEVIGALKRLARDLDQQVWWSTFSGLTNSRDNTTTSAVVLADAIASPEVYANLRQLGSIQNAFAILGAARDQAGTTVPVLIDIVDGKNGNGVSEVNSAIEALGKLGPAAKAAIPTLERVVSEATDATTELKERKHYNDFTPKFARRALRKIRSDDKERPQDNN